MFNKSVLLLLSGALVLGVDISVLAENQPTLDNQPVINPEITQTDNCTASQCNERNEVRFVPLVPPAPPLPASYQLAQNEERVTSVSQLSDVQPSDWAFVALQSLVERYGVIAGYPDGTFKGDRAMTRYEFAAGLNAVLDKIDQLITAGLADTVEKVDLVTLQKLREEFTPELAILKGRIDALEARTANIESQQFSTTVVLGGQTIFGLAGGFGGNRPGDGEANPIFTYLTQIQLASSFTGKDRFRLALVSGNAANDSFGNPTAFNTNMARLAWQADYDNQVRLDSLEYRVAGLGDRVVFTFKPVGFSLSSVLSVNSPYADAGQGAISLFGGSTSILKIGSLDAGLGFDWLMSDQMRLQLAYGTRTSNDSSQGLFGADHSALGVQLLYKPTPSLITGLAYVNAYSSNAQLDTGTGSNNADTSGGINEPSQIHGLNASLKWQLTDQLVFGAWGGIVVTDSVTSDAVILSSTYTASLGVYDPFGRKGDLLGFVYGQPLKLNNGLAVADIDTGNSTHYEVFYRYLVNDNISITPGFFIVTDPDHFSRNNDIFVGTIRTTFSF
ncbi:iron uptake porin [Anabaena sp. CCY 9402-a]|uniref:iron uptake porin n=1 Tax=Anabaena sp. CCY 9402-a TaxID=3103867 RepID=UPI0039C69883